MSENDVNENVSQVVEMADIAADLEGSDPESVLLNALGRVRKRGAEVSADD
jgi:hypothetical protein